MTSNYDHWRLTAPADASEAFARRFRRREDETFPLPRVAAGIDTDRWPRLARLAAWQRAHPQTGGTA